MYYHAGTTKAELKKTQEEMKKVCEDKNVEIKSYRLKIDSMGTQYESVLMVSEAISCTRVSGHFHAI